MDPTDSSLLNYLEDNEGFALVSDDTNHWAVVDFEFSDNDTRVFDCSTVSSTDWKPSIREAIIHHMKTNI